MAALVDDTEGFEFDFETQRFLEERWDTETGKIVAERLIEGIEHSVDLRGILDPYVIERSDVSSTYGFPIYPKDLMVPESFWVLNQDDLRGIQVRFKSFESTYSLDRKQLAYAYMYDVNFSGVSMGYLPASRARFEKCKFKGALVGHLSGYHISLIDCDFRDSTLLGCYWRGARLGGSDFRGAKFGAVRMEDVIVDHRTVFDDTIRFKDYDGKSEAEFAPDFYRDLRMAYQRAEIYSEVDKYLFKERTARRIFLLRPRIKSEGVRKAGLPYFLDAASCMITGYGTQPIRILSWSALISFLYAGLYYFSGQPFSGFTTKPNFLECLYFSFTAFATLGFGDLSYPQESPTLRLISTSEAWVGAVFLALLVATVARKTLR